MYLQLIKCNGEANMSNFKVDDYVYCPTLGTGVYQLLDNDAVFGGTSYPFKVVSDEGFYETLTDQGCVYEYHKVPVIFHATEANRTALNALHGKQFDKPIDLDHKYIVDKVQEGEAVVCVDNGFAFVIVDVKDGAYVTARGHTLQHNKLIPVALYSERLKRGSK